MLGLEIWLARRGLIRPLASRAKEGDRRVRLAAATALAEFKKKRRAVEALCVSATDEWGDVREAAARSLADAKLDIAIPPLRENLHDKDAKVRKAAAQSLLTFDAANALWGWAWLAGEGSSKQRAEARQILLAAGADGAAVLRAGLTDGPWLVRAAAAEIFGAMKDGDAEEALCAALETDADGDVRKAAADALGEILGPKTPDSLLRVLNDAQADLAVRLAAARALSRLKSVKGLHAWVWMLAMGDDPAKTAAREALAQAGPAAFEPICAALKDGYWTVRRAAAGALVEMRDRRAVGPLCEALTDADWQVRLSAAEALGKLADPATAGALLKAFGDAVWQVRAAAAAALAPLGQRELTEPLIAALGDPAAEVCIAAVRALGLRRDPRALEPLTATLRDRRDEVRAAAAAALGDLGTPAAAAPLGAALKDLNDQVRVAVAVALGKVRNPDSFRPLVEALNDWYSIVGYSAARALLELGPPANLWGHAWLMGSGNEAEKTRARAAIREAGRAALEPLAESLKIWHTEIRCAAALALGEIGDARVVGPLVADAVRPPLLPEVMNAVFQALARARQPGAGVALAKAIQATVFMPDDAPNVEKLMEHLRLLVQQSPWLTADDRNALAVVYKKFMPAPSAK